MKNDDFSDDIIYDLEEENYEVEELTDEELEEIQGGGLLATEDTWQDQEDLQIDVVRNFKYTTTEPEICLTDLTERLGKIDNIEVISNPINAKISCIDNLISIENQGIYGLVQMEVSGHNVGEAKSARTANVFVVLD